MTFNDCPEMLRHSRRVCDAAMHQGAGKFWIACARLFKDDNGEVLGVCRRQTAQHDTREAAIKEWEDNL